MRVERAMVMMAVTVPVCMGFMIMPGLIGFMLVLGGSLGAFRMIVVILVGVLQRLDALGEFDDGSLRSACVHEPLEKPLELEAVDQHDACGRYGAGVCRARLVDVGVPVRPDQGGQVDAVAADVRCQIRDDREGRDDLQSLGRRCGKGCGKQGNRAHREGKSQQSGHG